MSDVDPALSERVHQWLSAQSAEPIEQFRMRKLSGGACQENFCIEAVARIDRDGAIVHEPRKWVLRSDAAQSLPGSLRRKEEAIVLNCAANHGVKTPSAQWYTEDLVAPGRGAYVMQWVDGESIGRRVVKAPALAKARTTLAQSLAEQLAKIHSIRPDPSGPLNGLSIEPSAHTLPCESALQSTREMLLKLPEVHPAIELAVAWLERHIPEKQELTLVHGDFRTGNFLVTPDGLSAVLDWEFAHWGDPMEDLSWLCVRDWRFGELAKPVGGFDIRSKLYNPYEALTGRKLDAHKLRWWEIMGNVRWATGSIMQGERYLSGAEADVELLAIARRACEMEWEALRLIRQQERSVG